MLKMVINHCRKNISNNKKPPQRSVVFDGEPLKLMELLILIPSSRGSLRVPLETIETAAPPVAWPS